MEQIKLQDESGDRKYFTQLPSIILNHSTANDQALYWQMKRFAGEDGKCFATQETLMSKLGIGRKAYLKSLNYLIKRGWIKYEGVTGGKTRPVKTYSVVDIWKENIMEYEKIPSESNISFNKEIPSKSTRDTVQKKDKIPSKSASIVISNIKNIHKEDINTETKVSEILIREVINSFKEVNPSYEQLFKRKNQRDAVKRLLSKHGAEKVAIMLQYAQKANTMPFAPTITTPLQLEEKLGSLRVFVMKEKLKLETKKIITL